MVAPTSHATSGTKPRGVTCPNPAPVFNFRLPRIFPLLVSALLCCAASQSQAELPGRYKIHTWQVQHGLPQNNVTSITQAPNGFLWFATPDALARFDGTHFEVFETSKIPELTSAHIRRIHADSLGVLWIATDEGTLVQLKSGIFTVIEVPSQQDPGSAIVALASDAQHVLWFMTEDGALFHISNNQVVAGPGEWHQPNTPPYKLFQTSQGQIWASNRLNLFEIQPNHALLSLEGTFAQYQFLAPGRQGGWWIAMGGKVRLWKDEQWIAELGAPAWERQTVTCAIEDRDGRLWVGSSTQGVFRYDPNGDIERFYTSNGLTSDQIQSLCEDREGNIWVATNGGGINRLHRAWFRSYGESQGLSSSSVTAITEGPNGEVWIGTEDSGLNRIKDGMFTQFGTPQGLASSQVRSLLSDSKGNLWVGTALGKFFKKQNERFVNVPGLLPSNGSIQALFEDNARQIWIGQQSSTTLSLLSKELLSRIPISQDPTPLHVTCMAQDSKGLLWIGTKSNGLFASAAATAPATSAASVQHWTRNNGLPNDSILSLFPQSDGSLWIGTAASGLVRFKNGRFVTCSRRDGLLDPTIHHIQDDSLGYLWFSSNQGVFRIPQKELNDFADGLVPSVHCLGFGISDGLPSLLGVGGFQPAGCKTRDGRLWFLTQKGVASIDPSLPEKSLQPTPVYLLEARIDGEVVLQHNTDPLQAAAINVPPGHHHYEFVYTGIHFRAPEDIRFRYRIEGLDQDWIESGGQRTAHFSALPAGRYRFNVVAGTPNGGWTEPGASLLVNVEAQIWEKPWFLIASTASAALTLSGLVRALTRRRWRRRLRELELQQKLEAERNRIAQDIHDDLGAGLTQIGWLGEMSTRLAENPDQVRQQCRKIVDTAHEMVTSLDEIVWAVRPQNDSLKALVEYLGGRVDELFETSSIRLWYSAPHQLPDLMVLADIRHHFFLICKEVLHNTLKHSKATEVRVELTFNEPNTLHISIKDNGQGFNLEDAQGEGNGLGNMKQRAERIGGNFSLTSQPGAGCQVELTISLPPNTSLS